MCRLFFCKTFSIKHAQYIVTYATSHCGLCGNVATTESARLLASNNQQVLFLSLKFPVEQQHLRWKYCV